MAVLLILWLSCGVLCYFIMKSKGYPNNTCLNHGIGGALLGIIWIVVVLCKGQCDAYGDGGQNTYTAKNKLTALEQLGRFCKQKEDGTISETEYETKKTELLKQI